MARSLPRGRAEFPHVTALLCSHLQDLQFNDQARTIRKSQGFWCRAATGSAPPPGRRSQPARPLSSARSPPSTARSLARFGFLVPSKQRGPDAPKAWKGSFAAAYLHFSTKSERYLETPEKELAYYLRRLSEERQPPPFKSYPRARRLALDGGAGGSLAGALDARSTHRRFARRAVTFEELSTLLTRAFGRSGWVDGGVLGKKLAKTSPSAGEY